MAECVCGYVWVKEAKEHASRRRSHDTRAFHTPWVHNLRFDLFKLGLFRFQFHAPRVAQMLVVLLYVHLHVYNPFTQPNPTVYLTNRRPLKEAPYRRSINNKDTA
jgi:hypothetical protein